MRSPTWMHRLTSRRSMRGVGVTKMLVVIPATLAVLLVLTFALFEGHKAYWDYQVREMCAKDGGVVVYERVSITVAQAATLPRVGSVFGVSPEALSKPGEPVFSRTKQSTIRVGNPQVVRYEQDIIRRSDGKEIAKAVQYGRSGGDFPISAFPSSFSCPDNVRVYGDLSQTFQITELQQ